MVWVKTRTQYGQSENKQIKIPYLRFLYAAHENVAKTLGIQSHL